MSTYAAYEEYSKILAGIIGQARQEANKRAAEKVIEYARNNGGRQHAALLVLADEIEKGGGEVTSFAADGQSMLVCQYEWTDTRYPKRKMVKRRRVTIEQLRKLSAEFARGREVKVDA